MHQVLICYQSASIMEDTIKIFDSALGKNIKFIAMVQFWPKQNIRLRLQTDPPQN